MVPNRTRGGLSPRSSGQAVAEAAPSRVVPKPVPKQEARDTRGYHIGQLKRRYSPKETELEGEVSLVFKLTPSDPDFPFDLDHLECDLRVPAAYPRRPPRLQIKNTDIPRGFAINIERGWDRLVEEKRGATLLALTNALDRRLESLLSEQKAETVKLTIYKDTRHLNAESATKLGEKPAEPTLKPFPVDQPYVPEESYSRDQIAEAKARRAQEIRQLEARMSRLPVYHKSSDGIVYTLPLEPKRRPNLPLGLQAVQSVQLIVPLLYPLQSLRVLLNDVDSSDAEALEELFTQKAAEQKQMSLMSHLNYLAQNMHALAMQAQASAAKNVAATEAPDVLEQEAKEAEHSATMETGKGHIHVIPRPPEWSLDDGSDDSGSSDEDLYEDEEDGGVAIERGEADAPSLPTQTQELGTAMSFPSIELRGIELLQVSVLSLSVKCDRCKTLNEVTGLKGNIEKSTSCKKCATPFTIRFRQELVHQNSTRAGFIDATACTVADLLPSTFVPTCGKCSTASAGLVSVRGETTTNVCRECHARFTFKIPDVKFLAYAPGIHGGKLLPPTSGPRRRQEKLGLQAGEPLPNRGTCAHYRRSYRWFRFSCCSKVHPCDRCHDAAEDHLNEWANRMICGWCSREQNYSVESCAFCGRSVIGKRGKGYWEGGKGTRDQRLMRRGDKRKYRRLGPATKKDD
ncbi:hypothetical protein MMYC01_200053 [Madurella mycetomatis]|uniref:CHY-type domain-containing protein n=1 Tax=Madurella mycetomatis TaxID=100816 RepID=A0A150ASN0_9PEZI|nr:hypothetical protein MMYC01_200053 [Madurella mycetomatis]